MTDTELYEIVKDVPRELWPEKLEHNDYDGWHRAVYAHNPTAKIGAEPLTDAHALLLWEGALSRLVNERGLVEDVNSDDGNRWTCSVWMQPDQVWYPTRIEALVAAVKDISK